ncbi:sh3 domain-containing protein [Leptolyngbya sp. Heron Island J]|uniref:SH3 domain-containing protein n=1 Tax=Leptolyngbya sp. Heron Island J TaxID=1385935 RepID=UPI0003B9AFB6|nr:SH3 domain-containing protein [Leptolyngbya sp. Heron Island J]ESA37573.1 sh3 domain-containing protein [Leptolyngbya sp. Heron Island J]
MVSKQFTLQNLLVGFSKFICGVAIALFVISLAGVATARYFLTQLSSLPERPVYENDLPAAQQASDASPDAAASQEAAPEQPAAVQVSAPEPSPVEVKVLYKAVVTYGTGLLVRAGAGADYETIDGIDYNETVEVLEESGRWFKVRTGSGVEGWIKGQGNTQRI